MARVSSRVEIDRAVLKRLEKAQVQALEMTGEWLHTEIVQARVMPRMDGTLQNESTFVDYSGSQRGSVSIVSSTPYARRLYFHPEYHFQKGPWEEDIKHRDGTVSHLTHEGNPNAKGKWFEDWMPGGKEQDAAQKTYAQLYRRIAGT